MASPSRYLPAVNSVVNPSLGEDGTLTFQNAAVRADVAAAPLEYQVTWYRFDNFTDSDELIGTSVSRASGATRAFALTSQIGSFVRVAIRTTIADGLPHGPRALV